MRKMAYITASELSQVVNLLVAAGVPDIYISDDRGGTECFVVIAQAKFLPDLGHIAWESVPCYGNEPGYYKYGNMPDEDD